MKQKLMIVTMNHTTKVGLKSYLSSILSQYLDIDAYLVQKASYDLMKNYDLVLLSSESAENALNSVLKPDIPHLTCIRTFNHTYLNKILMIPPGSAVYLVNDSRQSTEAVIEQLSAFGISQYHFIPFYPGCAEPDYTIQYAVTVGESRLVPPHITTIIDIGNRIADISTINEIIVYFNLPMSLVNEITKNYINHIVQILKLSNYQLSRALNTQLLTQSIINNVSTGICLLDENGYIKMVNHPFIEMLALKGEHLIDTNLNSHLQKYDLSFDLKAQKDIFLYIKTLQNEIVKLKVQEIEGNNLDRLLLVHANYTQKFPNKVTNQPIHPMLLQKTAIYTFKDYITREYRTQKLLESAKRISLTDYPVLIQGENGTGRNILAQSIHNNSKRCGSPFVLLNISNTPPGILESELLGIERGNRKNGIVEEKLGVFELANTGTLYLEGIHDMPYDMQCILERILENKIVRRLGSYEDIPIDVRIITSSTKDLFVMVASGQFREDLFYSINIVSLDTIPLKNRREDIPLLFHHYLKSAFNNSNLTLEGLCTDSLRNYLVSYSWPGNAKEINNLCKYFSCIRTNENLTMKDLPSYILNQFSEDQKRISLLERQILQLIFQSPKIGRNRIYKLLNEQGTDVSEGKIRGLLQSLSDKKLIKMNRTKGGCEITEEGELLL